MPQVAARLSNVHEQWLKSHFRTKGAGAEFVIPWMAENFARSLGQCRMVFSDPELKVIILAHKDTRLLPEHARAPFLVMRVLDACEVRTVHSQFSVSKATLEVKLKKLDEMQAAALSVWATAYWVSREGQSRPLDEYCRLMHIAS